MFGYLRVFILVSLISVVIIAVMVGVYLGSVGKNDLMRLTENQNNMLVSSYHQAVWQKTPLPQTRLIGGNRAIALQKKEQFVRQSALFLKSLGVNYFTIYDAVGQPVYIHQGAASNIKLVTELIKDVTRDQGQPLSMLIERAATESSGAKTLLRTFSPLGRDKIPNHFVEVHSDITEAYNNVVLRQWVASGVIILVFLLLMWILIQTSKRAERIIAGQHERNMELAKKAAVAESESEQKSMFLANVSHELRTPLNAIIGFSELIKRGLGTDSTTDTYGNYVNDIHSAGVHLLSLINDILDFSKAEAGKLEIDIAEVNLSKMVKNCLRLVEPRAQEAQVELVDSTPKDMLTLTTDSKKLKQVLLNLLSNSVKFTPEGGNVRVSAWRNIQDGTLGLEVRDSGIGMKPKDISRAMSPFGQVDSALSRKYEGTGLGLPLTKKFVEVMGGEFKIESEEGVGTTITVTLPLEYAGEQGIAQEVA